MLKVIIVDDEIRGQKVLQKLLSVYDNRIEIMALCDSASSAEKAILQHRPDLVFLDIEMPGGNGFTVLENTKSVIYDVILTTAHNQYAIKAFRYSAMDYLLKPIIKEELDQAIQKAEKKHAGHFPSDKLDFFKEALQNKNALMERIGINTLDGFHVLQISEIIRLQADSNYTTIHLIDGKKITVAKTLKDYDEMLSENGFYRVHQSHLINIRHVKRYLKGEGGMAVMTNGAEVEISRRNKAMFLSALSEL